MATPEFEQTGSTSGQRISRQEQTRPRRPSGSGGLDRFAQRFLERNPGAADAATRQAERLRMMNGIPAPEAPTPPDLSDLTDAELQDVMLRAIKRPELPAIPLIDAQQFTEELSDGLF